MPPSPALIEIRHQLHRCAEPSNEEVATARLVRDALAATRPDRLEGDVGGNGLLAVFRGNAPGPTVVARCDMDAVPVPEGNQLPYASTRVGFAHKCGHDGHMAMLVGAAREFARKRPERGRAVLLFQPAEETGEGAARVLEDTRFRELAPDRAVAVHNLPRVPLGRVVVRSGPFASASKGMTVDLHGTSSHAAEPHAGTSPVAAAAAIVQALQSAAQRAVALDECVQATVVGIEVGGPNFGTCPGDGRVMATLRAHTQTSMERLASYCERVVGGIATAYGLRHRVSWTDVFPATENDPDVCRVVAEAAASLDLTVEEAEVPFPWSEDFGHFCAHFPAALFGLGSGEEQPTLHHPDYDFPDELLPIGSALLAECVRRLLADK